MFTSAKKFIFSSVIALCLSMGFGAYAGNVIFDLNGVCFDTNKTSAFWQIKMALAQSPLRLIGAKAYLFNFLEPLMAYEDNAIKPCDATGKPLPAIMDAYMKAHINSAQALQIIKDALTQDTQTSSADKKLLRVMSELIFNPQFFVKSQDLIDDAIQFVQECKDNGHKVYILSNWDSESFDIMYDQYPDFFNMFDGIMISGDVGANKPDPAIYKFLLQTYNLDPRECVFLDDQQMNIDAAELLGIKGIHVTRKRRFFSSSVDFKRVRRRFKRWERGLPKKSLAIA